jgi:predicted molibdopterin-dependent oxidoreductase YjgC
MVTRIAALGAGRVTINFEGRDLVVAEGQSVAAALLEAGVRHFRETPVTASPRGPFCLMGVCFDCLVIIDGQADQQACMRSVREGMRIERQSGSAAGLDAPLGEPGTTP